MKVGAFNKGCNKDEMQVMLSSQVSVHCELHGGNLKTAASRMEVIRRVSEEKVIKSMTSQKELALLKTWEFIENIK